MTQHILAHVPIKAINLGERARKEYTNMEELQASLLEVGMLEPLVLMADESNPQYAYLLLGGGRRLRAATTLGWETVPAHVYPYTADTRLRKVIELTENIQRVSLTFAEEAILTSEIHNLMIDIKGAPLSNRNTGGGQTKQATAEMLGRSVTDVRRDLEIAEAISRNPEIAKAKNKTEAYAVILKEREADAVAELATRMRRKSSNTDTARTKLIEGYLIGETIATMDAMAPEQFSLAEIDPPYGIELRRVVQTTSTQLDNLEARPMNADARAAFIADKQAMLRSVYRVMKPNSWIILWYAMDPWGEAMYQAALAAGFEGTRTPGLWVKNNGKTRTPNIHLGNWFEPFMYFRKGNPMLARPGARNVFPYAQLTGKSHPNEKPIELYEELLRTFAQPSARVLSPYCGSGNILLAAANADMEAVGIDKDPSYRDQFSLKAFATVPGQYRSYG